MKRKDKSTCLGKFMLPVQKIWLNWIYIIITINQWHKCNWTKINLLQKAYLFFNCFQKDTMKSTSLGFALLMGVVDDIVNTDHPYPLNVFADYDQLVWIQLLHIKEGVSFIVKTPALNEPPELLQPAVNEQGNTETVCLSVARRAFTETQSVQNQIHQFHCEKYNQK